MNINLNLYKLLANYLYCKTCDNFLTVKYDKYESHDSSLVEFLIKSNQILSNFKLICNNVTKFKNIDLQTAQTSTASIIKKKIYISYFIHLLSEFLKTKSLEELNTMSSFLIEHDVVHNVPHEIIDEFKNILSKLVKFNKILKF